MRWSQLKGSKAKALTVRGKGGRYAYRTAARINRVRSTRITRPEHSGAVQGYKVAMLKGEEEGCSNPERTNRMGSNRAAGRQQQHSSPA